MKNNDTPACLAHQDSKNLYRQLLMTVLQDNNVKSITATSKKEHFFDKIENNGDGTITVHKYGNMKFDNLYMDYTCDFARCLSYIEDSIYCTKRNMDHTDNNYHGYIVEFND